MTDRQLTLILLIAMALVIVLGGGAIYYFRFVWLPEAQEERDKAKADYETARNKKNDLPKLREKHKKLTKDLEEVLQRIPKMDIDENDAFANVVDRIRRRTRVFIEDARYKSPTRAVGAAAMPAGIVKAQYDFTIRGGFFQLLNFLNHIENDPRFLLVEDLQITAKTEDEKTPVAFPPRDFRITFSNYMLREGPPGAPKPGEKAPVAPAPEFEPAKVHLTTVSPP